LPPQAPAMADASPESIFKPNILRGRVALVTGGTSGIGFEISKQLGLHGCTVFVMGRRREVADGAAKALSDIGIDAYAIQGDVRSPESAQSALQTVLQLGRGLHILVNCAAGNFLAPAESLKTKGFRTVLDIDTVGTYNMSHTCLPALKESGTRACVINITATLQYGATWWQTHASAAKAAVDSITRSLGLEWGEYGIRVVGVAPGPIAGTAGMAKLAPGVDADGLMKERIPLEKMGTKWDIGMACVFLASEGARFVTGETLVVDGAEWMWRPPLVPREMVTRASRAVESQSRKTGLPQSKL